MISKELLSEVLGFKVTKIHVIQQDSDGYEDYEFGTVLLFSAEGGRHNSKINIHELAYKCKEWCTKYNFKLESELTYLEDGKFYGRARLIHTQMMGFCVFGFQKQHTYKSEWFENYMTEPEAIFRACQWVLENKPTN